ncbi:metallophosphoesterase family protein [Clostridium beijerinckii]|uniref:metallophosphoesterase family protein n=1 Tax=Clostridium beijerinckii TaxID=1520 RepID=UPI0014945BF6|nr:metallophosphoesterase [Clostridium beijerinckii]NOW07773.1 DNA repair exonuclease SbcCD nuclease subunit [Clostridium beijerinckii]NYC04453.1 DNA repair exonuclease SbcCD nuclease subunit [Clostridium beijerinckii]
MNSSSKYAILHLSDLHVEDFKSQGKGNEYRSRMCEQYYPDVLIKTLKNLKKSSKIEVKLIIISGDVANQSLPREYLKAKIFLEKLVEELELKKEQILIIPGNHDINRNYLNDQYEELVISNSELKPNTLQKEKLSKYEKFYNEFYNNDGIIFDATKAICCEKYIKDLNLLILGINSIYRESFREEDHKGEINNEALRRELKEIDRKYSNCFKVAVFHHSPKVTWGHTEGIIQNWPVVRETFMDHNINVFFYGHTHECLREKKRYKII